MKLNENNKNRRKKVNVKKNINKKNINMYFV